MWRDSDFPLRLWDEDFQGSSLACTLIVRASRYSPACYQLKSARAAIIFHFKRCFLKCLSNSLFCISHRRLHYCNSLCNYKTLPCSISFYKSETHKSKLWYLFYKVQTGFNKCGVAKSRDQRYFHFVYPVYSAPEGIVWVIPANLKFFGFWTPGLSFGQ